MDYKTNVAMDQLTFKFPFSKKYFEQDFFVSSNNFSAYKLINGWPNWPGKWLNIFGEKGSGKTHLSRILEKKIEKIELIMANNINNKTVDNLKNVDCLIIDDFNSKIDENILYSLLSQSKLFDNHILINSKQSIKNIDFQLVDLKSRIDSFIYIGIDLPSDELLKVIITKNFSDKQIKINPKLTEFIIKNVERSYEKMSKFLKDIDELSLTTGKSININLIKKVLNK